MGTEQAATEPCSYCSPIHIVGLGLVEAVHGCLIQSCPCEWCGKNRVKLVLPKGVKDPLFPFPPPPPAGEDQDEALDPPLGEGFWYF